MIDPELLAILVCPATRQPLREADAALLDTLNRRIDLGDLESVAGQKVAERLEAALVREDGTVAYPVRQGIPVLLPEEGLHI